MAADPGQALAELTEAYWEGVLERSPTLATFYGDYRYNDRLPDMGPNGREAERSALAEVLRRLRTIPQGRLSTEEQITSGMLLLAAEHGLTALELRFDQWDVDQLGGPQVWLLKLLNWHPLDTQEHVEQLAQRYQAFSTFMDQYLENLREGVGAGRVAYCGAVERVVSQLRALLASPPSQSPLAGPVELPDAHRARLVQVAEAAVYPAYARMLEYLGTDYAGRARDEPGIWAISEGERAYVELARRHTTTTLTPEQLHQIGLDELAQIREEVQAITPSSGRAEDPGAFAQRLKADPANFLGDPGALVEACEALLRRVQALLPRYFGRLPRAELIVKPVESYAERDAPAAFYYPPAPDGSRPGIFYINTFEPGSRPSYNLPALVAHEGVPGHHLQIALAQEIQGLPAFRRLGGNATAFVEGWALYTERLADEMGLYTTDLERFGMLSFQAWRAARLVVDTGLHWMRWTRQQAIEFALQNVGLTELETAVEIDRYITWPGQALAYKVGQREIEALRRETRQRLGAAFSLEGFHDEVLRHGALPLSTLRQALSRWA